MFIIVLCLAMCTLLALSATPTVSQIERAFNLHPGMSIPVVLPTGERVNIEYLRTEPHGSDYAVIVRLQQ